MKSAIGGFLAICLCGCVSAGSARSTQGLYEEAVQVGGFAFRCRPDEGSKLNERLQRLIPWLEAELGKEQVDAVRSTMAENLDTTDFVTCPTGDERARARGVVGRLLIRLEARSRT